MNVKFFHLEIKRHLEIEQRPWFPPKIRAGKYRTVSYKAILDDGTVIEGENQYE